MITLKPRRLLVGNHKHNLFARVADQLGGRIVRGDIRPGDPFPIEAELGEEFGVSRSVVREAVKSLAAKGLLESRTRTGIRVMPETQWNLFDPDVLEWRFTAMAPEDFYEELFEIRRMIEPQAAWLAAQRATPAQLADIATAFDAMAAAPSVTDEGILADLAFHRAVLAAAQNPLLLQMGNPIGVGLLVAHRISKEAFRIFLPLHEDVMIAIREKRPEAARDSMEELLTGTRDFLGRESGR